MRRNSPGQMVVLVALMIPVLLGAVALGTDVLGFLLQLGSVAESCRLRSFGRR